MSASSIDQIKTVRSSGWTHLNLQIIENTDLSIQARLLHTYLISRPPGWEARRYKLIEFMGSRYALDKGAKELEAAGYVRRKQIHAGGLLTYTKYTVTEQPWKWESISEPKTSTLISEPKTSKLKNSNLSSDRLSSNQLNNNQSNSKHLGYAGTEVPVGADAPAHDLNPHAGHLREHEQRKRAALEEATKMPEAYLPVIDAWGKVATKHDPKTKVMAHAISLIRKARTGTLFKDLPDFTVSCRKYGINQIVRAIERFGLMRNNPDYLPTNKKPLKVVSLDRFFYDKFAANKSWFAQCMNGNGDGPMMAADADPELTTFVKEMYDDRKGGKIDQPTITSIAAKLHRYWKTNGERLKRMGVRNEKTLVIRWLSFLEQEIADWGPQHFLHTEIHHQFEKYVQR